MKKYFAEFLGTFSLSLVVMLSVIGKFPVPTPILASIVVMTFVYIVGPISGAQLNPAVTIGAWTVKKIKLQEALYYIVSQFLGVGVSLILLNLLGHQMPVATSPTFVVGVGEMLGTAFLTFGIASVVFGKEDKLLSGLIIGLSLLIGISVAGGMGSAGVLNPAVTFGLGLFNLVYIIGQILGGALGFWTYKLLIYS